MHSDLLLFDFSYTPPLIEVFDVFVERGFNGSGNDSGGLTPIGDGGGLDVE